MQLNACDKFNYAFQDGYLLSELGFTKHKVLATSHNKQNAGSDECQVTRKAKCFQCIYSFSVLQEAQIGIKQIHREEQYDRH